MTPTTPPASSAGQASSLPTSSSGRKYLDRALRAYRAGDYRQTKQLALLARKAGPKSVRRDARQLLRQLKPPQLTLFMLGLTAIILTAVTVFAFAI